MLHSLILKLYDAMEARGDTSEIARALSREDMLLLADQGAEAHESCWSKGFVLTVARKLADMAAVKMEDRELRKGVERMIVQMDILFAKLPKGINVDLSDLTMEIFNQACIDLDELGADGVLPANILGQACANVLRDKAG